jgi:hypothetical protein
MESPSVEIVFEGGAGDTETTETRTKPMRAVFRSGRNLERMASTNAVATIFHNPH